MGTLYKALEKQNTIQRIFTNTFENAILEAYSNPNYLFFHNSELIDVKDRFRIFNYNNVNYIVKSMSEKKAKIEFDNSLKCASILNGKKVNDFIIEVVMPRLYRVKSKYYIITEYKGNTLQENLYTNKPSNFTIYDLKELIITFSKLGIEYPGLSPRNMVVSIELKKIFLFDFENAKISRKNFYYNMLYKTNILVNWSYFFEQNDLLNILKMFKIDWKAEPALNDYENNYKEILGIKESNFELRKNIMNVVLKAEKKIKSFDSNYCLLPMDMAAIISDLYDFNMDAIMDMTFYSIRCSNELLYKEILQEFSTCIITFLKNNDNLKIYLLPILLFAVDQAGIYNLANYNGELLAYFFNNKPKKFKLELRKKLYIIFKTVYPKFVDSKLDIDSFAQYLLKFNVTFDKSRMKCYNNTNFTRGI